MFARSSRVLFHLRNALTLGDRPRSLAFGVSLGMVIGLVPKGNLTCLGLCLIALVTPVNLGVAMVSAVSFTLLAPLADSLLHGIGVRLLDAPQLLGLWEALAQTPLMHWTGFNNTVVAGSLTAGMILFLPVYWFSHMLFALGDSEPAASPSWSDAAAADGRERAAAETAPQELASEPDDVAEEPRSGPEVVIDWSGGMRRVEPPHERDGGRRPLTARPEVSASTQEKVHHAARTD